MMEKSEEGATEVSQKKEEDEKEVPISEGQPPPTSQDADLEKEKEEKEKEKEKEKKEKEKEKEEKEVGKENGEEGGAQNPDSPQESSPDASSPTDPQKPKPNLVGMRRESFTQMLRNSWKDSLNLRKGKLKDTRQGSISNLNSLPSSPDQEPKDKSGSLSRRIGKVVISGVNKLRGKNKDSNDSKDSDGSDQESDEEGNGPEYPEGETPTDAQPNGDQPLPSPTSEDVKRVASLPNLSVPASPPASPRRNSDPPAPLSSILRTGTKESSVQPGSVKFNEIVTVRRTWAKKDYDRKGEVTWKLTPEKAIEIRNELNEFKREMDIHDESRCNTHFY